MNDLPREIREALVPAFEAVDELSERINGSAVEHPLTGLAKPVTTTLFRYGARAPRA